MKNIVFIESDFGLELEGSKVLRPNIAYVKNFRQRIGVNISYLFRLFFLPKDTIIIAPWGLFWIPALLNISKIKKFNIISLTCDTFLGRKTIAGKYDGIIGRLKYFLAVITYKEPRYYIYCSQIVRGELEFFGVPESRLVYKYQEWCRDEERFNEFQTFTPNIESNHILFIGHYYNMFQKRLDILLSSYLQVVKEGVYKNTKLTVVGGGWEDFFGKEKVMEYKLHGVYFEGYNYDITPFIKDASFYIHPGEYEGFGVAVLEAMNAGIIPLVSNLTGASEAVELVDTALVTPLLEESFVVGIKKLFGLPIEKRKELSLLSREVAASFNKQSSLLALDYNLKKILKEI